MKKQIFLTLFFIGSSSLAIACPTAEEVKKEINNKLTPELAVNIAIAAGAPTGSEALFAFSYPLRLEKNGNQCTYKVGESEISSFRITLPRQPQ